MRFAFGAAILTASLALSAAGQSPAFAASGKDVAIGDPLALTFYVAPAHPSAAEAKAQSIQTPGSADYHHFLTVAQYVRDYAVSDAELQNIENSLVTLGFSIGYVYPNHLAIEVLGSVGTAQQALGVHLKQYVKDGRAGFAPTASPVLPAALQGKIRGIGGLSTLTRPHAQHMRSAIEELNTKRSVPAKLVGGTPGDYLPADFANIYDVNPIYRSGIKGHGSTVGIVTLNNFDASDAYTFWKAIGLRVSQDRITKVDVDGGFTAASNNADGESESDLDTEYSGALAPQANVRVYVAPNETEANYINAFEAAASENIADTVSASWGGSELYFFPDLTPSYPSETYLLDDFHDVFLEMALQGQTVYIATGDSGSFDTVRGCRVFGTPTADDPVCNAPYAVQSPANDPLVTATGGTTLPFSFTTSGGFHVSVPTHRAWSWDYLAYEAAEQGFGAVYPLSRFFSVGTGGGVSSYFKTPWYQKNTPGITKTKTGQYLTFDFGSGAAIYTILPSQFAGRNLPDISTNADPESGYQIVQGNTLYDFGGGTSFVAPQLNGVTALFVEALGGRVGQINPALYQVNYLALRDSKLGNNWGYDALPGYDNATGLGTLDAAKLLSGLQSLKNVH